MQLKIHGEHIARVSTGHGKITLVWHWCRQNQNGNRLGCPYGSSPIKIPITNQSASLQPQKESNRILKGMQN